MKSSGLPLIRTLARRGAVGVVIVGVSACGSTHSAPSNRDPASRRNDSTASHSHAENRSAHRDNDGAASESPPVVEFDDRTLTLADIESELVLEQMTPRQYHALPEHRAEFVEALITRELLAEEAIRRGYGEDPRVARAARQVLAPRAYEALRNELSIPEPTEAEMRDLYEREKARFQIPATARARIMLVRERDTAERVLAELLANPPSDRLFMRLADEHGWNVPMLSTSGLVGPFQRPIPNALNDQGIPPPLAEAVFETRGGAIVPRVVEYRGAYYLARVIDRASATNIAFDEARPQLRDMVSRLALEREIDRILFGEAEIAFDADALESIRVE